MLLHLLFIFAFLPLPTLHAQESIPERITAREFPSVFQAWNPADAPVKESSEATEARHDLLFHDAGYFWLHWDHEHVGLATGFTADSLKNARARRKRLLERNSQLLLLCEIRYRDAHRSHLPDGHPWWLRDDDGTRVVGWEEGGYFLLDYKNPEFRTHVARQAAAALRSGVFDGVMLDWWLDDADRLALVKAVRAAIGKDALILVNANDRTIPQSAPYINGLFMECYRSQTPEDWQRIRQTLRWAESNLRTPRINCLETWYDRSRADLAKLRLTTTLALTHSDGYVLFSDPNDLPTADHLHDWYAFWDAPLGKPLKPIGKAKTETIGSATLRRFTHGVAIHNPRGGEPATVTLSEPHRSMRSGTHGTTHIIPPGDGDILIRVDDE